jgi:hypothetical protein
MTDRELLELAAKAAGAGYGEWTKSGIVFESKDAVWNPLTDDGDALRLAVAMGMKYPCFMVGIYNRASFPHASASVVHFDGSESYVEQDDDCDMNQTVRRAIVRAAAEMGKV